MTTKPTEQVKCANCGKPVDPTAEEVLCDACIGRQQVIEAIDTLLKTPPVKRVKGGLDTDMVDLIRLRELLLALTYPSGQPMIGMLKEDQSAACTHLEDNLGEGKGMVTVDYCNGRASLIEQNFKRILPTQDGGK